MPSNGAISRYYDAVTRALHQTSSHAIDGDDVIEGDAAVYALAGVMGRLLAGFPANVREDVKTHAFAVVQNEIACRLADGSAPQWLGQKQGPH